MTFFTGDPFGMNEATQKMVRDMQALAAEALKPFKAADEMAAALSMGQVDIGLPAGVPTPFEIDEAFQKPIRDIQAAEARLRDQRNAEFRAAEKELRESERMQDILTRLDSMRRPDKLADLEARIEWLEQNSRRRLP